MIAIRLTEDAYRNPNHRFLIGEDNKPLTFKTVKEALWYLVNRNFELRDLLSLDFCIEPSNGDTQLYGWWCKCIRDKCPENGGGKCRMIAAPQDYPANDKCYFPEYVEYSEEWERLGAFEKIGEKEVME